MPGTSTLRDCLPVSNVRPYPCPVLAWPPVKSSYIRRGTVMLQICSHHHPTHQFRSSGLPFVSIRDTLQLRCNEAGRVVCDLEMIRHASWHAAVGASSRQPVVGLFIRGRGHSCDLDQKHTLCSACICGAVSSLLGTRGTSSAFSNRHKQHEI
jgi:hypothetical protein